MLDINFRVLKKPNLWSYASLRGHDVMIKKAEDKDVSEERREILEYIIKYADLNEKVGQKLNEIKTAIMSCGYDVNQVEIRALSRVLVGSSETFGEIPFEVGLRFDPILNVPYIPGSTIKGAVRSATFDLLYKNEITKGTNEENAKNEVEDTCAKIFGGSVDKEQSVGLVGFTDAYPIEKGDHGLLLYPDIIAPHYKDDTKNELDVQPKPIIYLAIAPGARFRFFIFYKRERKGRRLDANLLKDHPTPNQLGEVDRGLLYAFIRGVGAKTALGYSIFEIVNYEKVSR